MSQLTYCYSRDEKMFGFAAEEEGDALVKHLLYWGLIPAGNIDFKDWYRIAGRDFAEAHGILFGVASIEDKP